MMKSCLTDPRFKDVVQNHALDFLDKSEVRMLMSIQEINLRLDLERVFCPKDGSRLRLEACTGHRSEEEDESETDSCTHDFDVEGIERLRSHCFDSKRAAGPPETPPDNSKEWMCPDCDECLVCKLLLCRQERSRRCGACDKVFCWNCADVSDHAMCSCCDAMICLEEEPKTWQRCVECTRNHFRHCWCGCETHFCSKCTEHNRCRGPVGGGTCEECRRPLCGCNVADIHTGSDRCERCMPQFRPADCFVAGGDHWQ